MRTQPKRKKSRALPMALAVAAVAVVAATALFAWPRSQHGGKSAAASSTPVVQATLKNTPASSAAAGGSKSSGSVSATSAARLLPAAVSFASAEKPLWIHVSIEQQVLTVYDAQNRVVKSWLCSTGSPGYDTPRGTFSVYQRGKSFYSKKYQEGAYYWVAFYEDYYIHSVPFDENRQIIQKVAADLGRQDSHGCVHLSIENSKWVYENIPKGTKVVID